MGATYLYHCKYCFSCRVKVLLVLVSNLFEFSRRWVSLKSRSRTGNLFLLLYRLLCNLITVMMGHSRTAWYVGLSIVQGFPRHLQRLGSHERKTFSAQFLRQLQIQIIAEKVKSPWPVHLSASLLILLIGE